ncbi:Acyl-CoA-binding domain-containing protein 5 [Borealophlyctis nickersoniae]|nr:Acyl-CoA-binding domain-containing protein 5 [Borealophlyctis nickersoniae]
MVLAKLSLQTCGMAAAVATAAADISFTVPRHAHNMHSTANRIIVLGGHIVVNDVNVTLAPDVARGQNIITSSVSAMDYGTGQTADLPVTPFDATYNPLNSWGAACGYDARTQYIQCFGGQLNGGSSTFNILSTFDTTTMKWIRSAKFPEVSGRAQLAGAVLGSSFYLYGGDDGQVSADLLRIDLTTYTLTRINASGTSPSGRKDHCIAALSDTKFVMHAGVQGNNSTGVNSVHIYDTQSNTWTDITPDNSTSSRPTPSPRYGTGCTVLNGSFYSFGGRGGVSYNDLWVLEPPNWTWRLLSPQDAIRSNVPSWRYYAPLVTFGKYLITHGGLNVGSTTAVIPNVLKSVADDTRLYFFNTETGVWVSSNDVLSDPWFKALPASNPKGGGEGGVNIGAIAGGVAAGVVLIVAVVGGIMFVRKRNARYLGGGKADAAGGPQPLEGLHIPEMNDVGSGRKLEVPEYDSANL